MASAIDKYSNMLAEARARAMNTTNSEDVVDEENLNRKMLE